MRISFNPGDNVCGCIRIVPVDKSAFYVSSSFSYKAIHVPLDIVCYMYLRHYLGDSNISWYHVPGTVCIPVDFTTSKQKSFR